MDTGCSASPVSRRTRLAEAPAAIERYRTLVIAAHGAESGNLGDALRMTLDFERARHSPPISLTPAEDLLALEESLSGATSEPYLRALQTVAQVYDYNGDRERALPLRRQMVAIADRVFNASDPQRGMIRTEAAQALAALGQFDEAERLAVEAVAIGQSAKGRWRASACKWVARSIPRAAIFLRASRSMPLLRSIPTIRPR